MTSFYRILYLCHIMINQKCRVRKLRGDQPQMQLKAQQNVQHLRFTYLVIYKIVSVEIKLALMWSPCSAQDDGNLNI